MYKNSIFVRNNINMASITKLKIELDSAVKAYEEFNEKHSRQETDEEKSFREKGTTFTSLKDEDGNVKIMELTMELFFERRALLKNIKDAQIQYYNALNKNK